MIMNVSNVIKNVKQKFSKTTEEPVSHRIYMNAQQRNLIRYWIRILSICLEKEPDNKDIEKLLLHYQDKFIDSPELKARDKEIIRIRGQRYTNIKDSDKTRFTIIANNLNKVFLLL